MSKMKSHRGAAKRFKKTAKGKIKRSKAFGSHLLGHKPPKRKRRIRKPDLVSKAETKKIYRLIPYK
ncbi:LSU ribosomal protein L35p [Candidatus Syntrophocurvum alkaliphilum]|uniref:Large ribosomal subunit protein bL35 n=1 Tax=Candidatus Syntrophocurvum alkaliphilum TaxID=2293317 RepID=A0A6I6DBR1_9FIRM|nr:50S ribosomal protein L35 [Candidatus Syntrophocurvum alkaliphilum]QGT99719.1 LSU ribosomal protein L35p [Candidatus Syntrophocurvum alkaliphilum]